MVSESEWTAVADGIKAAHRQLSICEAADGAHTGNPYDGDFGDETNSLKYRIIDAHLRLSILLERVELPGFLQQYLAEFAGFEGKLDEVGQVINEPWLLYSLPLQLIDRTYEAARAMLKGDHDIAYSGIQILKGILEQAPNLLHDRGIVPTSETEVRKVLYETLRAVFPDTIREVPVPKVFKTFKCDIGVPNLKVMVEVKFADSESELKAELEGIFADMHGYSGDPKWDHYFAVFYLTNPIASTARVLAEFKGSKADANWTPIVVYGPGSREPRREARRDARKAQEGAGTAVKDQVGQT